MKSCRDLLIKCRKALLISLAANVCLIIALILALVLPSNATDELPVPDNTTIKAEQLPCVVPVIEETKETLKSLGEFKVTAYCPCVKCCGIWSEEHPSRKGTDYVQKTASGTIPKAGRTVAADISVLPFGTVIIMDGHEYTVEDRGGAVDGNSIDIFFDSHEDALEWGVQYKTIYIKGDN